MTGNDKRHVVVRHRCTNARRRRTTDVVNVNRHALFNRDVKLQACVTSVNEWKILTATTAVHDDGFWCEALATKKKQTTIAFTRCKLNSMKTHVHLRLRPARERERGREGERGFSQFLLSKGIVNFNLFEREWAIA